MPVGFGARLGILVVDFQKGFTDTRFRMAGSPLIEAAVARTADLLKAETVAAAKDAGFASTTAADVTVDFWLECNGTRAADYNTVCPDGQTYGRWVSIDLQGTFSPMFRSRRWPGANTNGTFTLHGRAGMRTQ